MIISKSFFATERTQGIVRQTPDDFRHKNNLDENVLQFLAIY